MCEVLERLDKNQILYYLNGNQVLNLSQHRFLHKRSCMNDIILFVNSLTDAYDRGLITEEMFFDFFKVFDKVPHNFFMDKLHAYGISE